MSEFIQIEKPRPNTTVIRMNRPERMNSMAFEAMVPLHEAIAQVAEDNDTHCVILTGSGRGFCSGADTQYSEPPPNIDGLTLTRIATKAMALLADLVPALRRMPQPVICAINGAAIGGGMCLTLGADIRIAAESACGYPDRCGIGVFSCGGHQQRAHRDRTRYELPAPTRDRLLKGLRDHALGSRCRRP